MKRHTKLLMVAGLALLVAGGMVLAMRSGMFTVSHRTQQATYYCPMHPTYTSDRPGDCPICQMRLVKRDAATAPSSSQNTRTAKDVCYLHTCPMVHAGQPCPMLVVAKSGESVTCPICKQHITEGNASTPRRILYWTDPMIPGYKSNAPGKSPMGMDLVPVYETAESSAMGTGMGPVGYAPVLLTPQKQQLIGVTTAPAQTRTLTKTIRAAGRIAYDPALYQAEAEYLQALGAFLHAQTAQQPEMRTQAEQLVQASRTRLQVLGLSPDLIQEMTGWSGPDQRLLLTNPDGEVWVYASIYEFELPLVQVGQTLMVTAPSLQGESFQGAIRAIDPVLDPATRTARVRAVLADVSKRLKPEMFVDVAIGVMTGDVLAVPEGAIFNTGTKQILFVDKGEGLFEPRDVVLGLKAEGFAEVKQGVTEGERVVTSGNFLIDSESRLKAALEGMSEPGHRHGQ